MTKQQRREEAYRLLTEAAALVMNGRDAMAVDRARGAITQLKLVQAGGSTIGAGRNSPRSSTGVDAMADVSELVVMISGSMVKASRGTLANDRGSVRAGLEESRDLLIAAFLLLDEEVSANGC